MVLVPTNTSGLLFWTQKTNLDGTDFVLEFRFNTREQCFYLMISLTDGTPVAQGIKLVSNYRLLQAYSGSLAPLGELVAVAYGADDSPAKVGELGIGQRVELVYFTEAEMNAKNLDQWRNPFNGTNV